jgi:hypothetical protein
MNANSKVATLHVSQTEQAGWRPTMGTDQQIYWYLFDGGEGGGGFRGKKTEPGVEFSVDLDAGREYRMDEVRFGGNDGQLTFEKSKGSAKRVVIGDKNDAALEAYYLIVVARQVNGVDIKIPCDPMIKNDPR